jgi:hypothetical protein
MAYSDEIDKAIAAHGMWKQRLLEAITSGSSEFGVGQIQVDNRCDFGKWFYGLPPALRETDQDQKIQKLHAAFHREAARVLDLALKGRKDEAMQALSPGNPYARLTGQLTIALTQWKQILSQ